MTVSHLYFCIVSISDGKIAHVALHDGNVGAAELVREKIFARRKIIKHHVLAPFECMLRVGSADQSQASYKCGSHDVPLLDSS